MKMSRAHCYFIALEFVKYTRNSHFKRILIGCIAYISREIITNIGTGYFHGESTSVRAGKIYTIILGV